MNWTNIIIPEITADQAHNFADQALEKAKRFFPDISAQQDVDRLKAFLEDETVFLKQAETHHTKWAEFYHPNVAFSNRVEQQVFRSILEQIESSRH